jgi:hypothetical protein
MIADGFLRLEGQHASQEQARHEHRSHQWRGRPIAQRRP